MRPGRAIRLLRARPRLLIAAGLLALTVWLVPGELRLPTRLLMAWDIAVMAYLILVTVMMARSDHEALQRRADEEDAGAAAVLALTIAAAVASLAAIGAELHGLHDAGKGQMEGSRLALAAVTILLSWVFVHTMFALHYAHDYYAGEDDRGGLKFPTDEPPDYWDFLYFAFTMGAASQTSDVSVTASRMRRFVLAHTILSFLFNTTVLALAINVGASLL
jgi:uncharacterized membrane protein